MVIVDSTRCCYCGGCVSVCPVDALTLAETRLIVNDNCTECENCVFACPVGALHLEARTADARGATLQRRYDVIVVGAGPGGATAAHIAAQAGRAVLLIEKRQEIGSPVRCAEGIGHEQLVQFIEPDSKWIAAEIHQLEITTHANGATQTQRASGGHGYILERRVFDRALAERAACAGATVRVKTSASGVLVENGTVRGIKIHDGTREVDIESHIVIAADGIEAQVGRWAGLDTQLPLHDTMVCAQFLLAGIDVDPTCTYYTISEEFAPGGYVWIFPKGEGKANVGLGVQADLPRRAQPIELLTRFIETQPNLARGHPVSLIVGNVPVALPPAHIVGNGIMLVGDAARQVDPLTGGGIINAMIAGKLAAQTAVEAIAARDTSARFLARYAEVWHKTRGSKLERNYRLREKFPPHYRTDERFVHAFMLATK